MEGKKLTAKEENFIREYLIDFNATQAAIRSGYSKRSATEIGYENLRKPHIKSEIDKKFEELNLNAQQTHKLMSDIARGNLNEYFVTRKAERYVKVKKHLSVKIAEIKEVIIQKEMFAERVGLSEEEYDKFQEGLERYRHEIIEYEIALERNPDAFIIETETELVDEVTLDLVRLTADKERGKIKSFQWTEFGPKVEMYAADSMLDKIARVNGMYKDKLEIDDKNKIDPSKLSDEVIKALLAAGKKDG